MDNNYTSFTLISINAALSEKQVADNILLCNENTKKYGLILTEQQALALSKTRTASLKESKRINDDFLDRESEQLLFQALSKRKKCLSSEEKQQVELH